jgi:casein kinase II subunit alpha
LIIDRELAVWSDGWGMLVALVALISSESSFSISESTREEIDFKVVYDDYKLNFFPESDIELLEEIGHGRFSQVYRARLSDGRIVAAKKLKPLEPWKLKREVQMMAQLQGIPTIIEFIGLYGDELTPILVTELGIRDSDTIVGLSDFKWAVKSLLQAINETHYRHIFHRDIKWPNLLVSFKNRSLKLIDWGLADFIVAGRKYPPKCGTKSYKAPELLMGYRYYGPPVDVWAAGVTMANLLYGCPSFFSSSDDDGVLAKQTRIFGHLRMSRIADSLKWGGSVALYTKQSLLEYALPHTRQLFSKQSLDLLQQLLVPEANGRVTAADALQHPFFDT